MRHDIDERNKKYEFSHYGYGDRCSGFSERGECHLTGHLDSEDYKNCKVDTKGRSGVI